VKWAGVLRCWMIWCGCVDKSGIGGVKNHNGRLGWCIEA